jgi:hypothetical protein
MLPILLCPVSIQITRLIQNSSASCGVRYRYLPQNNICLPELKFTPKIWEGFVIVFYGLEKVIFH